MNAMIDLIKKYLRLIFHMIPPSIRNRFIKPIYMRLNYREILRELSVSEVNQRIIIFCIPEHGNIGDQAIAMAQSNFFRDYFHGLKIIEIPDRLHMAYISKKKRYINSIKKNDVIVIHGGGFLGTLWSDGENELRNIIKSFSKNKVIILPQTIFFENSPTGEKELSITKEIWQNHKNLTVCLRERNSYEFVKNNLIGGCFKNVLLIPDIVLYLNETSNETSNDVIRNGVLFCLRTDKEKVLEVSEYEKIHNHISEHFKEIHYTDTLVDKHIRAMDRKKEVECKLNEFKSARLVITDRLHGMIFAAITSTPCIAFNNVSNKVEGVYEWIKDLDYIVFAKNADDANRHIDRLLTIGGCQYRNEQLRPYYDNLSNTIRLLLNDNDFDIG